VARRFRDLDFGFSIADFRKEHELLQIVGQHDEISNGMNRINKMSIM